MPNCEEHYDKYLKNTEFMEINELDNFKDWFVTGAFYCSVHLIEGYLYRFKNKDTESHTERFHEFKNDGFLQKIYSNYTTLYHESRKARYYNKEFTDEDITRVKDNLKKIEDYLKNKVTPV